MNKYSGDSVKQDENFLFLLLSKQIHAFNRSF